MGIRGSESKVQRTIIEFSRQTKIRLRSAKGGKGTSSFNFTVVRPSADINFQITRKLSNRGMEILWATKDMKFAYAV